MPLSYPHLCLSVGSHPGSCNRSSCSRTLTVQIRLIQDLGFDDLLNDILQGDDAHHLVERVSFPFVVHPLHDGQVGLPCRGRADGEISTQPEASQHRGSVGRGWWDRDRPQPHLRAVLLPEPAAPCTSRALLIHGPHCHETAPMEEGDSILQHRNMSMPLGSTGVPPSPQCLLILLLIIFPTKLPGLAPPLSITVWTDRNASPKTQAKPPALRNGS